MPRRVPLLVALLVSSPLPAAATSMAEPKLSIATDVEAKPAAAIAVAPPVRDDHDHDAPRDIVLGMLSIDVLRSMRGDERHHGGRVGLDMLVASGRDQTRLAAGLRLLLGGASGFGPEGQLKVGIAQAIADRAVVALVAPLGFTFSGPDLDLHGYVGLEGLAAIGKRGRGGGFDSIGVELAAEIANRGPRARIGIVKPGKEIGLSIGLLWQRDSDADLVGIYFAETPGR